MSKANVSTVVKDVVLPSIDASLKWFTDILNHVEGKEFYIAMVFITLACGFLLSNFRVAMYVGSDFSGKTASFIKKAFYRGRYSPGSKRGPTSHGKYEAGYTSSDVYRQNRRK